MKRSVSLDDDVAARIEELAREDGMSFSAWLTAAAEREVKLREGLQAMAEWDAEDPLTPEERAEGDRIVTDLLAEGGR